MNNTTNLMELAARHGAASVESSRIIASYFAHWVKIDGQILPNRLANLKRNQPQLFKVPNVLAKEKIDLLPANSRIARGNSKRVKN